MISRRAGTDTSPTHDRAANAALITSSIFIDLFGLSLIGAAIFGPTFAPFLAILIVFGLRQICQGLCTLPPPPGIIWRNPGFPALLVTYDVGNDFFFSGHTALAVLGALQAAYLGPPWLAVIAGVHRAGRNAHRAGVAGALHAGCRGGGAGGVPRCGGGRKVVTCAGCVVAMI